MKRRDPGTNQAEWAAGPFYVVQSELSPAILVHSSTKYLGLFQGMPEFGLGGPSFVAWATPNGPRTFKRGDKLDVGRMAQSWVLVWWAGAQGWSDWDSPWVVYLQHQPLSMQLDDNGLHLEFGEEAGDVVMLPLYGYDKPPQRAQAEVANKFSSQRKVKIKTWEWPEVLTRDPLTRIRYWAAVTREFPLYCEDTISVDRARDTAILRSRFQWRSIRDDWRTVPIKLAPLSPPLGHAVKLSGFPLSVSRQWFDLDYSTPAGPLLAVEGADDFDVELRVLQYVNETEIVEASTNNSASVQAASSTLNREAARLIPTLTKEKNQLSWCESLVAAGTLARTLPLVSQENHSNAVTVLRNFFERPWPVMELCTDGRGNVLDSGSVRALLLNALWSYAHFSDDWAVIRKRWSEVRELLIVPESVRWAGFAPDHVSAIGDQAAHCAAFARMAYKVGDMDAYHFGCAVFARELTHLFIKQRGGDYFREHQPLHSKELVKEEAFLTELAGPAGWKLEGPDFPAAGPHRQFTNRWARFQDADVGRFYRDYLRNEVVRELNWLQHQSLWKDSHDPVGLPSLAQLRSLLNNESSAVRQDLDGSPAEILSKCLTAIRTSHPTRYERLIPGGPAGPLVVGLERAVLGPNPTLLTELEFGDQRWPRLTWPNWKTATGAVWSFGEIRPVRAGAPLQMRSIPLNWNTHVVTWTLR